MARLFKYVFSDGITKNALSRFTGFFDPQACGGFNMQGWEILTSTSYGYDYYHNIFRMHVDEHWNKGPYLNKGRIVDRFWDDKETYPCSGCKDVLTVRITIEDKWFFFGYKP